MPCTDEIFSVDSMTVNGEEQSIESGTATITGAAGFENEAALAASGTDAAIRKRVERNINANILFTEKVTPGKYTAMCNVQVVLTNKHTGQRVRAGNCRFKSLGDIGSKTVELSLIALTEFQWLQS
jgi:hypothetical protein